MWLVVGLGNPGKEYASHRHNVGFMALDELSSAVRADAFRSKWSGEWCKGSASGDDVVLLKPLTFMNLSGQSVQPAAAFFKVPPANVLVVHDELDIPFGDVRLKMGGGHAGHNGLRSIIQSLGTNDFPRLRIGIGRPKPGFRGEVADYVLSSFDTMERAELGDILRRATDSVLDVLARGLTPAMNKLNTAAEPKKKPAEGASRPSAGPRGESPEAGRSPRGRS
jgi:PTH1 family peptidyl-tRNA hydrolase